MLSQDLSSLRLDYFLTCHFMNGSWATSTACKTTSTRVLVAPDCHVMRRQSKNSQARKTDQAGRHMNIKNYLRYEDLVLRVLGFRGSEATNFVFSMLSSIQETSRALINLRNILQLFFCPSMMSLSRDILFYLTKTPKRSP